MFLLEGMLSTYMTLAGTVVLPEWDTEMEACFEAALCGIAIYDADGRMLEANGKARQALAGPDVWIDELSRYGRPSEAVWRTVISGDSVRHTGTLDMAIKHSDDGTIVVALDDHSPVRIKATAIRQYYRMTMSPAMVAALIVEGMTVEEVARERGISYETARKHLRKAMQAVGVHRQQDLVRVILTSPLGALR